MNLEPNSTSISDCEKNALIVFGFTTAVYLVGIFSLLCVRFRICSRRYDSSDETSLRELIRSKQMRWLPKQAEAILTGKPIAGKVLLLARSVLYSVCSVLYVWNTYIYSPGLCLSINNQPQFVIEVVSNCVFFFIFVLKITASKNLLSTWLSVDLLIDHYTIIPIVLALLFGYYQYYIGFLYFTRITKITESLVLLNFVDEERNIRKLKIVSKLMAAWFTLAGVILLLERIGNFWMMREEQRKVDYFDCVYFLLVTIATVGYGDFVCTSYLGRLVTIFIIIAALISVTTHMSELYELFRANRRYAGTFNNEYHPRHVIVCGAINLTSVSLFLDSFVNADTGRYDKNIMMVFMAQREPDLRLKALFKRESMHATYLRGDATSPKDLKRAKVRLAEAVIILADCKSADPAKDDWENIMRVVSVKNLHPKCRILCALTLMENKALMSNIPGWREEWTDQFDRTICISQLKLGLMSLSCLTQGVSALLTNLVVRVTVPTNQNEELPTWMKNYFRGTQYGLFTVRFSPTFDGLVFQQVVSIVMRELRVLVLAVQLISGNGAAEQIIVNPGSRLRINSQQMRAIVLAENFLDAQHLRAYCITCSSFRAFHIADQIHSCKHRISIPYTGLADSKKEKDQLTSQNGAPHSRLTTQLINHLSNFARPFLLGRKSKPAVSVGVHDDETMCVKVPYEYLHHPQRDRQFMAVDVMRDSTGLFYWVEDRQFSSICLTLVDMVRWSFTDHILVCLPQRNCGFKLGLATFVMPLRSTRIPMNELKPIVFLCDSELVRAEWYCLRNFPEIYVLSGSPLSRAYLRAAGVERCSTCVVLPSNTESPEKSSGLPDKESILCTLNIRRLLAEILDNDKKSANGRSPMVITALSDMGSASLLSITNEYKSKNGFIRFSPQYASGSMFASPLLNSLASNVFFDPTVLTFLETVLLGGPSHEVEKVFAEDGGFFPGLKGQTVSSIPLPCFEFKREKLSILIRPDSVSTTLPSDCSVADPSDNSTHEMEHSDFADAPAGPDVSIIQNSVIGPNLIASSPDLRPRPSTVSVASVVPNQMPRQVTPMLSRHTSLTTNAMVQDDVWTGVKNQTGRHKLIKARSTESDTKVELMRANDRRSWRPLGTNSFLSYTTSTGNSVKVCLSRLRLFSITSLGAELNKLMCRSNACLTFGVLFETVLKETGTICIGLYRRVQDDIDEEVKKTSTETSGRSGADDQIERYVYTFPESDTRVVPDDLVYCFTAVSDNCEFE
ncbi:hypothetical protein P879_00410 [Paragonimus westermani]|uniref:RCK N-terminal domain-containing protein n=1 Tax=Paragonimus westermani TaxID=34504 RepID=A0A8T0E0U3_9TREM|nr:hypothetical protein P879_00410 [Paragonimus westermani]